MLFQVKSRMMGDSTYRNTVDCFIKTMKTEVCIYVFQFTFTYLSCFRYNLMNVFGFLVYVQGIMAFYKGFLPNFTRLGTWNVIMFLTLEQVNKILLLFSFTLWWSTWVLLFFLILFSLFSFFTVTGEKSFSKRSLVRLILISLPRLKSIHYYIIRSKTSNCIYTSMLSELCHFRVI